MKLISISKNEVKVGDYVLFEDFRDDTFYDLIKNIKIVTDKATGLTYQQIITENDYKISLNTGVCMNNDYVKVIEYRREDEDIIKLKNEIKNTIALQKQRYETIQQDLTEIIKSYMKDHNIDNMYFDFSNDETTVHVVTNTNENNRLDELQEEYFNVTGHYIY